MLAQFYPPIIGGEERHVRNLSLALAARGHHVAVVTLRQENARAREYDQGVLVYRIDASMQRANVLFSEKGRQHAPPFPDPEALLALRKIIQQEKPDVIHAHNWIVHSFTPLKAWSGAKLVVTLHDYSLVCATKRLMCEHVVCHGPVLTKCLQCATAHYGAAKGIPTVLTNRLAAGVERRAVDMFLPVSQAVAEGTQLARRKVPYVVIPNFIPDDLARRCNPEHPLLKQLPAGDFILFVGDLSRDKGVEVLLHAYAKLNASIPLVLIGRGVHGFVPQLPPNVYVLHSWPHEAVLAAWQRCTLAVAPSIWSDPCPTVAMEAMCMGRPVIASQIGGLADIVKHGETGLLFPPGDTFALCAALERLIGDSAYREQMGELARERVVWFQAQTVVPRIECIYQDIVAGSVLS